MKKSIISPKGLGKTILQLLLLVVYIILHADGLAQAVPPGTWLKTIGGKNFDAATSVQQTTDGGFILAGYTFSYGKGSSDIYLVKTDMNGDTVWTKTIGGIGLDEATSVQQTSDGGYILTGAFSPLGGICLIKTNAYGDTLWARKIDENHLSEGNCVRQTRDGGYIVVSTVVAQGVFNNDIYLAKADSNGNQIWGKTFGGASLEFGDFVQQTNDDGFIVVGSTYSYGRGSGDVYLIKTDANGDSLWTKTFGGTFNDYGKCVQQTSDGGFIMVGTKGSNGDQEGDVFLIRTNESGDTLWTKTFGRSGDEFGSSVMQTSDGGFILAAFDIDDLFFVKTDANGYHMWTKYLGGAELNTRTSVEQTTDGGFVVVGNSLNRSNFGNGDINLIKTDNHAYFRTLKPSDGFTANPVKLRFNKKGRLIKLPNGASVLYAEFDRIGKKTVPLLGIPQTNSDSAKKYSWVICNNRQGNGAKAIVKLFTAPHTGKAYPLDSLRKTNKKSKKMKGAISPDFKTYNNVAIEQGVLFNLNLLASQHYLLPDGFGSLVFSKNVTVAGHLLQGKTLTDIGKFTDSMMTFYNRFVTNDTGYRELALLVDSVLRPINEAFMKNIDSSNIDILVNTDWVQLNPYAINLFGVRTAEETGLVEVVPYLKNTLIEFFKLENPQNIFLQQNYPNPFNPLTVIGYSLLGNSSVSLKVYNILGEEVATLINNEELQAGYHQTEWNASNFASGVYFYRLNVNNGAFVETKKLVLMK